MKNISNEVLVIKSLKVRYSRHSSWVLNGIDLSLFSGESLAIVGSSGCGKSTLAQSILKLLPESSLVDGFISLGGKSINKLDELSMQQLRGEYVGLVFQDPMSHLNPLMSIGDHLMDIFNSRKLLKTKKWKLRETKRLLNMVGIDIRRIDAYPHELSGGMQQRLGIALAIALNPSLIIADEPTTSLDIKITNKIMGELSNLCKELGIALLLISHDLKLASKWCDRIAIINRGKIVENDLSEKIIRDPSSKIGREFFKSSNLMEWNIPYQKKIKNTILEVENLRYWHSDSNFFWRNNWIKAVDGVSFFLHESESLGVIGASGCGKSTLCKCLVGLLKIRGGIIRMNGEKIHCDQNKFSRNQYRNIQMIFQDPFTSLNPKMKVMEIISDPYLIHNICSKSQAKEKVRRLLSQVGLEPTCNFEEKYPSELSGGQRQRVVIARSLTTKPKVLICDESISMLDPQIRFDILNLLAYLKIQFKLSILFVTHDLIVANKFCERLLVMDKGQVIECGETKKIFNNPKSLITKNLIKNLE